MPDSLVRPEFGPSLPELLGRRVRALSRPLRLALAGAALVLVAFAAWLLIARSGGGHAHVQHRPIVFNLTWDAPLRRAAPRGRELVRLEQRRGSLFLQSMSVEPLALPREPGGDPSVGLPILADAVERQAATRFGRIALGNEGRIRLNPDASGYGFVFRGRLGRRQLWGRISLLAPPEKDARLGAMLVLLGTPEAGVRSTDQLGYVGALKQPYRSFRFGTERP